MEGLGDYHTFSVAELYLGGILPDPPSTSRAGFTAQPEERCHALTHQGTQCRRRFTFHDTTKSEGEKTSLEKAEDKLCEQHKSRARGLADLITHCHGRQRRLEDQGSLDGGSEARRQKTPAFKTIEDASYQSSAARRQKTHGVKAIEDKPYQSSAREDSLKLESTAASHIKKSFIPVRAASSRGGAKAVNYSTIGIGKSASGKSGGGKGFDTYVPSKISPLPATSMSGAQQDDPGHIAYPQLRQVAFESDRSFRLNHQESSLPSVSAQQPSTPDIRSSRPRSTATVTEPSNGEKYSSVIMNCIHLIVDKHVALQDNQGVSDIEHGKMYAKEKKDARRKRDKQQSEIDQLWKQLDVILHCVDEVVGVETEDEGQAADGDDEEDMSELEDELPTSGFY